MTTILGLATRFVRLASPWNGSLRGASAAEWVTARRLATRLLLRLQEVHERFAHGERRRQAPPEGPQSEDSSSAKRQDRAI
jgi:hypothetical protein